MNDKQHQQQEKTLIKKNTLTNLLNMAKKEKQQNDKIPNDLPPLTQNSSSTNPSGNVKVVCRVRPFNQKELALGTGICVEFSDNQTISIKTQQHSEASPSIHKFQFDRVFDMKTTQDEVYHHAAKPTVESILEGFNGTIFAYGQTSSGKTHTMQGHDLENPKEKGIIPRMVNTIFEAISATPDHIEFTVKVSMVEIYMEKIRDLISPEKINLKIREDKVRGVYIEDVTESYVSGEKDVLDIMHLGTSNRAISATSMNEGSSRSHLIFMMSISQNNLHEMSAKTGKLFLVDLAGSEKISKTGAEGRILEEAKKINQSLSSLGNVINALTDGKTHHIPYRNSKLTRILQESLGGNSRTTLIITCSPSIYNDQETLSTLRFGFRAKSIKNTPKINRQFTIAELQLLLEKSEKNSEEKDKRVKRLESLLLSYGHAIPKDDDLLAELTDDNKNIDQENKNNDRDVSSDEECDANTSKLLKKGLNSINTITNNDDLTRIKLLEQELEQEKNSVRIQTEKLNILRQEYAYLNSKLTTNEKEKEALTHNLEESKLKLQEMEESIKEKEDKLEQLPILHQNRDSLLAEVENLKKSNEQMLSTIEEKNEEIQKLKISLDNAANLNKASKDMNSAPTLNTNTMAKNELVVNEITKELKEKAGFKDDTKLYKIIENILNKYVICGLGSLLPSNDKPLDKKIMDELQKFQEQFIAEQEKNTKLRHDYEKLSKNYERVLKANVPNLDEIKQKILEDILAKERARNDKDKALILKDLQNRVDKITKLEMELDEEREKNKALENKMADNEKKIKLKVNMLRNNLEQQLSNMYHQLAAQRDRWNLENQLNQKKIERKSERILNLEKQLLEAKDLVVQYKGKIESLKTLIAFSSSKKIQIHDIIHENQENIPIKNTGIENNKVDHSLEENRLMDDLKLKSVQGSVSSRIVKPIRGGQMKSKDPLIIKSLNSQSIDITDKAQNNESQQDQSLFPYSKHSHLNDPYYYPYY